MSSAPSKVDRRRSKRHRVRLRVRYWNDYGEHTGFTADVSGTGLFVETNRVLPPGTRMHLDVETPDGSFLAEGVVARVVRASTLVKPVKMGGLGLRLVGLEEAIQAAAPSAVSAPAEVPALEAPRAPRELTGVPLELDLRDRQALSLVFERDVKQAGLYVRTESPPARDSQVVVRLLLPPPHPPVEVEGTVVQVMAQPRGVAVQIRDVDPLAATLSAILGR